MEHLHPEGWGMTHLGNKDFSMHVYRGTSTDGRYRELSRWVDTTPAPLTMSAVGKRVDLDNMLRHMFTFVFCNTTDWAQGAAILETNTDARWFWLHWDLDHSFRLRRPSSSDRRGIELFITSHRPLELLDVRARIFNRLREEDPSFRTHYVTLVSELLNHRVEASFFNDVTDAPTSVAFVVDGYRKVGSYKGWYFDGMPVQMQISGEDAAAFSYWLVDGERRDDIRLVERIDHDTAIHAVMQDVTF